MGARETKSGRQVMVAARRRRLLPGLPELWWNRRHIAALGVRDHHPLDEVYVVDAMARQLEEIRNLPEPMRQKNPLPGA